MKGFKGSKFHRIIPQVRGDTPHGGGVHILALVFSLYQLSDLVGAPSVLCVLFGFVAFRRGPDSTLASVKVRFKSGRERQVSYIRKRFVSST